MVCGSHIAENPHMTYTPDLDLSWNLPLPTSWCTVGPEVHPNDAIGCFSSVMFWIAMDSSQVPGFLPKMLG